MKKRTILPIAGLVALSGVAAISGTFAWFQTNRSATITFDDAVVQSRDSALIVKLDSSLNTLGANQQDAIDAINDASFSEFGDIKLKIESEQVITDISGNGDKFYKIDQGSRLNDNYLIGTKIDGFSWQKPEDIYEVELNAVGDANGHLIDFTLELSRDELTAGQGRKLDVYLGEGTAILPVTPTDNQNPLYDADQLAKDNLAVAGSRMSLAAGAYSELFTQIAEEDTFVLWSGYDENGDATYVMDDVNPLVKKEFDNTNPRYMYLTEDAQGTAYQFDGYQLVDAGSLKVLDSLSDSDNVKIGQIDDVTDTIELNVRVWIEGTDADIGLNNPNEAVGGKIRVVLDLFTKHV